MNLCPYKIRVYYKTGRRKVKRRGHEERERYRARKSLHEMEKVVGLV